MNWLVIAYSSTCEFGANVVIVDCLMIATHSCDPTLFDKFTSLLVMHANFCWFKIITFVDMFPKIPSVLKHGNGKVDSTFHGKSIDHVNHLTCYTMESWGCPCNIIKYYKPLFTFNIRYKPLFINPQFNIQ